MSISWKQADVIIEKLDDIHRHMFPDMYVDGEYTRDTTEGKGE